MRGRRQFEFSVLDLEAAFVTREDIMGWIEVAAARATRELVNHEVSVPFPGSPMGTSTERQSMRIRRSTSPGSLIIRSS